MYRRFIQIMWHGNSTSTMVLITYFKDYTSEINKEHNRSETVRKVFSNPHNITWKKYCHSVFKYTCTKEDRHVGYFIITQNIWLVISIILVSNLKRTHRAFYLLILKSLSVGSYKSRGMCRGNKRPIFYKENSISLLIPYTLTHNTCFFN